MIIHEHNFYIQDEPHGALGFQEKDEYRNPPLR